MWTCQCRVEGKDELPLTTLPNAEPRIVVAFFIRRPCCWLMVKLVSTKILLCRTAFQLVSLKGYWWMSYYSSPGAAYYVYFIQTSQGSSLPISPVCCSASEWQHGHLFCQSLLPVSHHLQTSCGRTLSYHPGKLYGPSMNPGVHH